MTLSWWATTSCKFAGDAVSFLDGRLGGLIGDAGSQEEHLTSSGAYHLAGQPTPGHRHALGPRTRRALPNPANWVAPITATAPWRPPPTANVGWTGGKRQGAERNGRPEERSDLAEHAPVGSCSGHD